jgi:hypothetical protein
MVRFSETICPDGAADKHAAKRGIAFGGRGGGGGEREQAGVDGVSCLGCANDLEQLHHGHLAAASRQ